MTIQLPSIESILYGGGGNSPGSISGHGGSEQPKAVSGELTIDKIQQTISAVDTQSTIIKNEFSEPPTQATDLESRKTSFKAAANALIDLLKSDKHESIAGTEATKRYQESLDLYMASYELVEKLMKSKVQSSGTGVGSSSNPGGLLSSMFKRKKGTKHNQGGGDS